MNKVLVIKKEGNSYYGNVDHITLLSFDSHEEYVKYKEIHTDEESWSWTTFEIIEINKKHKINKHD